MLPFRCCAPVVIALAATACNHDFSFLDDAVYADAVVVVGPDARPDVVTADTRPQPRACSNDGTNCPAGQVCDVSVCAASCSNGRTVCNRTCVAVQSDPTNCGTCSNRCASGTCVSGECVTTCARPLITCHGACVDPQHDTTNCGACDVQCTATQMCNAGSCAASPYGVCGQTVFNCLCAATTSDQTNACIQNNAACTRCIVNAQDAACPSESRAYETCLTRATGGGADAGPQCSSTDTACLDRVCASQISQYNTCLQNHGTDATYTAALARCTGDTSHCP